VLGKHLDKRAEVRCSDWEASTLSAEQVAYAAKDAHVAVDLFARFHALHEERLLPGEEVPAALDWCAPLVDCEGKRGRRRQQSTAAATAAPQAEAVAAEAAAGLAKGEEGAAPPLGAADVQVALHKLGLAARASLVRTSEAEPAGCLPVKSLAVFVQGEPLVAVIASRRKLDPFRLARERKVTLTSRRALSRQVRLASPAECVAVFGFRPGTVPPLAHRLSFPLVLDAECAASALPLLAGGGDFGTLLRVEASALTSLPSSSVAEIAEAVAAEPQGLSDRPTEAPMSFRPRLAGAASASVAPPEPPEREPGESRAVESGVSAAAKERVRLSLLQLGGMRDAAGGEAAGLAACRGDGEACGSVPSRAACLPGGGHGGRPALAVEPRFVVDAMMGRLLRWLRVLGVDSLLREEGESLHALFGRCQAESRILLTRDRKLAERKGLRHVAVFVVSSDESREQLREVVAHFGLRLSADEFMMRCSVCNGRGYVKLSKAEVAGRDDCPPKVLEAIDEFYACRSCGKLYWEGPKSNNAFEHFTSVFDGFGPSTGSGL